MYSLSLGFNTILVYCNQYFPKAVAYSIIFTLNRASTSPEKEKAGIQCRGWLQAQ